MQIAGLLAIFVDIDPGREALFLRWHSREHLGERVGHPGFRRGMRFRSLADPHRYALLYEADDAQAFASADYERSLREPTPLSVEAVPAFARTSRTICEVQRRSGAGVGGTLVTATLQAASEGAREALSAAFHALVPRERTDDPVLRIDLVAGRRDIGSAATPTSRLRPGADRTIDAAVLVHLADRSAADRIEARLAHVAGATVEVFGLAHILGEIDL